MLYETKNRSNKGSTVIRGNLFLAVSFSFDGGGILMASHFAETIEKGHYAETEITLILSETMIGLIFYCNALRHHVGV